MRRCSSRLEGMLRKRVHIWIETGPRGTQWPRLSCASRPPVQSYQHQVTLIPTLILEMSLTQLVMWCSSSVDVLFSAQRTRVRRKRPQVQSTQHNTSLSSWRQRLDDGNLATPKPRTYAKKAPEGTLSDQEVKKLCHDQRVQARMKELASGSGGLHTILHVSAELCRL